MTNIEKLNKVQASRSTDLKIEPVSRQDAKIVKQGLYFNKA